MTQERTYPAHIIAQAREIAERHYPKWCEPSSFVIEALCEALSTTPPSEEAMKVGNDVCDKCRYPHPVGLDCTLPPILPTPKPEPTEDHLRRACKELGVAFAHYTSGMLTYVADSAVHTVARLLAERDATLTALQKVEDRRQDAVASMTEARAERDSFKAQLAEVMAERDAMQARWGGEPRDLLEQVKRDAALVASWPQERRDMYAAELQAIFCNPGITFAEPTPDPDLVLAREADEKMAEVRAANIWLKDINEQMSRTIAEQAAELAKVRDAANALFDFHNLPMEYKRPDVHQRRMSALAAALGGSHE